MKLKNKFRISIWVFLLLTVSLAIPLNSQAQTNAVLNIDGIRIEITNPQATFDSVEVKDGIVYIPDNYNGLFDKITVEMPKDKFSFAGITVPVVLSCSDVDYDKTTGKCEKQIVDEETGEASTVSAWVKENIPLQLVNNSYIFNIKHLTAYTVGSDGDYEAITACLFYNNGTSNTCQLNDANADYIITGEWLNNVTRYNMTGMILGFSMEEGSGTEVEDLTGNNNNGTVNGNAAWTAGKSGNAIEFDSIDDNIDVSDSPDFDIDTTLTLEAWVRPAEIGGTMVFLDHSADYRLTIMAAGVVRFRTFNESSGNSCDTTQILDAGKWYHLASTYDGSAKKLYINGVLKASCDFTGNLRKSNVIFSVGSSSTGSQRLNGTMDEVAVYNRTLNEDEIKSHAYGRLSEYAITPADPNSVIDVNNDNITVNCSNSLFIGSNTGRGIYTAQTNTTIKNCDFNNYDNGIYYFNADIGLTEGSSGENNTIGVYLWYGTNIDIRDSNFTNSSKINIKLDGGTKNITIINVYANYSKSVNLWAHTTNSKNITVKNSYFGNSSSETCVLLSDSTIFINNTVQNCLADDKLGLTIGTESIIKDNTFYNNNVHMYLYNTQNSTIENNLFNKTNEADFSGYGAGFCLGLFDNSANNEIVNNTFADCLDTGIAMGEVQGAGNLNNNNITGNVFINTIASSYDSDIYIYNIDVENTSIWLNHFYTYGVNDSGLSTDFCVNNEGNFYEESITGINETDCGLMNITVPDGEQYLDRNNSINITWTKQSSIYTINYQLYYSNNSGVSWNYVAVTSALNYFWNISDLSTGIYYIKIIPNDGSYNSTNVNNTFQDLLLPDFTARELLGRPTNTSIVINLINGEDNISVYIEYENMSAEPDGYLYNTSIINLTNSSLIEFNLTGLDPDSVHYYRVRAKETDEEQYGSSAERRFRTRRESYPFNFTIIADAHVTPKRPSDIFRTILGNMVKNDNSDFALHLGDNIMGGNQNNGYQNETEVIIRYKKFRDDVSPVRHPIPLFSVIGNWEGENGWFGDSEITTNRNVRKKYIPNPLNTTYPEGGNEHEDYFAFTWGNALFVVLNVMTYTPANPEAPENWTLGNAQLGWLNQTLNNSKETWKFIFIHHAVGGNGSDLPNQDNSVYGRGGGRAAHVGEQDTVHNLMLEHGVQAFFYGHDHSFVNISVDGIQYMGIGSAGTIKNFCNEGGYSPYYVDYELCKNKGRARIEVISNETAKVFYINQSENIIANLTLNSTI